jgi:hypothetical protein
MQLSTPRACDVVTAGMLLSHKSKHVQHKLWLQTAAMVDMVPRVTSRHNICKGLQ